MNTIHGPRSAFGCLSLVGIGLVVFCLFVFACVAVREAIR